MENSDIRNLLRVALKKYGILIIFVVFSAVLSIITPNFLTFGNIFNILRQASMEQKPCEGSGTCARFVCIWENS